MSAALYTSAEGTESILKRFEVTKTGAICFNDSYIFPSVDGLTDEVLQTNGAGVLS